MENEIEIYNQDRESIRQHDKGSWSRLQTLSTIEALFLYGLYQFKGLIGIERKILIVVVFILVFILSLMILRDRSTHIMFLERIKKFEKNPLIDNYPKIFKGYSLYIFFIILINLLNIYIGFIKW